MSDQNGLSHVDVESGVSHRTGEGFCKITATTVDGTTWEGELTPDAVRMMALGFLAAAEAAEQDAIVYALMLEAVDQESAGRFVAMMRSRRSPP